MRFVPQPSVQPPAAPSQAFTFSSLLVPIGVAPSQPLASEQRVAAKEEQCQYIDQYSIGDPDNPTTDCCSRLVELLHGTLISNPVSPKLRKGQLSSILGPTGHYERFSSWSHVAGFVGFGIYAVVRQIVAENRATVEGVFASVAAWTVACVFLVSSLYHATAADPAFAKVTRILDYGAIYIGLSIGATADIAAATRGFDNVPVVTIVDIPIAAVLLIMFFLWRRMRLPTEETWQEDFTMVPPSVECSVGRGLFSKGHVDLHHSQLRQATSLLLTASYFMTIPAAVMTLGRAVAIPVIALQAVGFVLAVLGMLLDRIWEWPNRDLVEGRQASCYPNHCGCVLTSHGVWHLIALVSGVCTVAAREYALASY
jgi:predicted membrane channel-forming protein YqfA (hemolysin III family)